VHNQVSIALEFRLPYPKSTTAVLFLESESLSILCLKASQDIQKTKTNGHRLLEPYDYIKITIVCRCETCRSSRRKSIHPDSCDQMLRRQRPGMAEDCCLCCYATWNGVVLQTCSRVTCGILVSSQEILNSWLVPFKECVPRAFCQNKLVSAFLLNPIWCTLQR